MEVLAKGTIEHLVIPVTDTLGNLTVIPSATYDILTDDDDETEILMGASAIVFDSMTLLTLVDTTDLDEGVYKLFVQFPAIPETPRLGPHRFRVDD